MKRRETIKGLVAGLGLTSLPASALDYVKASIERGDEPQYLDDTRTHVVIEGWVITVQDLEELELMYAS